MVLEPVTCFFVKCLMDMSAENVLIISLPNDAYLDLEWIGYIV